VESDPGAASFEGIFFGLGSYGQLLPKVWTPETAALRKSAKYAKGTNELVDTIRAGNAAFFPNFEKAVFSGDPVKIDRALANGMAILEKVGPSLPSDVGDDLWIDTNVVYYQNTAVTVDSVVTTKTAIHDNVDGFTDPYTRMQLAAVIAKSWASAPR